MKREDVFRYVEERYGTQPDYPWSKTPGYAILRHKRSRKWYAAVINPTKQQLGLTGEERIDIVNLKCEPDMIGTLRMQKGILPGYHMNKEHWITVLLDGSVPSDEVCHLLDVSYFITAKLK